MNKEIMQSVLQKAADKGRGSDTILAHLTQGEVVIPAELMQQPEIADIVNQIFASAETDINQYTVGHEANSINPETGHPEFKWFKKIFRIAAPIIGSLALPGLGTALGTGLAAATAGGALGGLAGGLVGGDGLKDSLKSAATGGLMGAGTSLLGGATGLLGKPAGATLAEVSGNAALQGPTTGSGLTGALTRALGGGTATGMSRVTSAIPQISNLVSGLQQSDATDDIERQLMAAQGRAEQAIQPYSQEGLKAQQELSQRLQAGFDPSGITSDPGYQFRLAEGQKALERSLAAQGLGESGAAMRASQELGQGMASSAYDTAYNQWLQRNQQLAGMGQSGQQAAGNIDGLYGNMGNVQAAATAEQSNVLNRTLAGLLGQQIIGYDEQGRPIYR